MNKSFSNTVLQNGVLNYSHQKVLFSHDTHNLIIKIMTAIVILKAENYLSQSFRVYKQIWNLSLKI